MPKLRPANPAAQHKSEDGVAVEIVAPGTGAQCGPKDGVNLRFAVWRADGSLFDCSERHDDARLSGTPATLQFAFLREPVQKCKVGGILRLEVPRAQFPNAEADTIWEIELTSVTAVPPFRACDPAKTVTTQSGLQYEVIELGQGDPPRASDTVVAFYTGWLTDGTMFDSAHVRGTPSEFPLNRVVRGWTEGLQLMKPGAKFLFTVPPDLAYGARGKPPTIPANATLVFLIELVAVKRK
ncbi:MAG: FKBP-type peptidyl-prolyl cis-trans isomerase [Planctomycetes bacterium]|nr:FKBP-type peptidyl-prolyl cis-trans isomerase [Planctomycetota bacterium]